MLILQAATGTLTDSTALNATTAAPAAEMNLWEMFQYGGPIMYVLVKNFVRKPILLLREWLKKESAVWVVQ